MAAAMPEVAWRFARNLAEQRTRRGYTQEVLAFRAGLHPTWVSCLEAAKAMPGLETIVKLSHALEIAPVELLAGLEARR
jgi:transcriptional regulator with XRE-family HTH domain